MLASFSPGSICSIGRKIAEIKGIYQGRKPRHGDSAMDLREPSSFAPCALSENAQCVDKH